MSEKTARTHNHVSNRAKPQERKVVYKSVLDNPFRIQWPFVPMNVQNSILALTLAMMDGIPDYQLSRGKDNRKRKRELQKGPVQKKRQTDEEAVGSSMEIITDETKSDPANNLLPLSSTTIGISALEPPPVLQHLVVGINEVTKRLEHQIQQSRVTVVTTAKDSAIPSQGPDLKIILVCRADIDPPLLIDHLPHLVAACNSTQTSHTVKLVPLPKGAEPSLAQAIGLRRAAVVGIDVACPELGTLMTLLDAVPTLVAAWIAPTPRHQLVPTHIKQVRTSAPKDMRAAKEAKQRRKEAKHNMEGELSTTLHGKPAAILRRPIMWSHNMHTPST